MDKITYNFKIKMSKEDAKYFEDGKHSVSIYSDGPGKIVYCFREIKLSDELDSEVCGWMHEKSDKGGLNVVMRDTDGSCPGEV